MYFDTHCHISDEAFKDEIESLISKIDEDAEFLGAIIAGTTVSDSNEILSLTKMSKKLFSTVGIHPESANIFDLKMLDILIQLAKEQKVVAVGEVGLDFYWEPYDEQKQKKAFLAQLEMAEYLKLPTVIHQRNVGMHLLTMLKENKKKDQTVILHCFSESLEMAREFVKLGAFISFAGPLTFKNAKGLLEVAKYLPTELILTETDSPYLTPHPFRGKRNQPMNVKLVADKLCELRGEDKEEFLNAVIANVKRAFPRVNI